MTNVTMPGRDGLTLSIAPAYVDAGELADGSGKAGETVRAYRLSIERGGVAKIEYWRERGQARARAERLRLRLPGAPRPCHSRH